MEKYVDYLLMTIKLMLSTVSYIHKTEQIHKLLTGLFLI